MAISEADAAVKYNVYLRNDRVELQFRSTDRSRVELAASLLKLVGVGTEVEKAGGGDVWYVVATTDRIAAGREELRKAIAEIVKVARKNRWIDADKAELWLEKLKEGRVLREGWPKYEVGLEEGALVVRFASPNPGSIERQAQRLRDMGLVEGVHFTVKTPEGGENGYVNILKEGLVYAAWLSVRGSERQRDLAAEFISCILDRARKEGEDVRRGRGGRGGGQGEGLLEAGGLREES